MTNHKLQTNDAVRNPTKEQWEEIVRVAKEQGISIYPNTLKSGFPISNESYLVYDLDGELSQEGKSYLHNILSFDEFILRMNPKPQGLQQGEGLADVTADQWEIIKLIAEKYKISIGGATLRYGFPNDDYPCILMDEGLLVSCMTDYLLRFKPLSFDVFIQKLINTKIQRPINVRLNKNHTAVVTANGVKVGCQGFTHEVIKELYEACLKVKPNA